MLYDGVYKNVAASIANRNVSFTSEKEMIQDVRRDNQLI